MTSVERVVEYAELESEAPWETDKQLPHDWPRRGSITFDRVAFSYSATEPLVLKNLTCCLHIQRKGSCLYSHLCTLTGVHGPWPRLICSQCRRCGAILFFFYVALFFKSIIKGTGYCAAESWGLYHLWFHGNTYHVIKTVQVDPFVPNLHFELPDGDNSLFTPEGEEAKVEGRGKREWKAEGDGWGWLKLCLMLGVYFAWLWLARAADFTMDGLISVEPLALTAPGRDLCRMPWGVKGFVHPDSSPDTLSQGKLHLPPTVQDAFTVSLTLQSYASHNHIKALDCPQHLSWPSVVWREISR